MTASKRTLVLLAGFSVMAFASQASAQLSAQAGPQREADIEKCIAQAHQQWPGGGDQAHVQRVAVYKACMVAAGQAP